jgi:hypothetical protein
MRRGGWGAIAGGFAVLLIALGTTASGSAHVTSGSAGLTQARAPRSTHPTCGHVRYRYRPSSGGTYHAIFRGPDYQHGIKAHRLGCGRARHFVRRYAHKALGHATDRLSYDPPKHVRGYDCRSSRDGDDSYRGYCHRGVYQRISFSASIGL